MRVLAEDTIALIIDFQERLVPVMDNKEALLHNTEILMKGLVTLGIPMIVTQQYTKGIGMTVPILANAYGDNFEYYDKVTFSCAEDEAILKKIEESGKRNIIVCGVEAHICVLQTVIDLLERGYHVILVEDCIGSRKQNDRLIATQRAAAEGALLTTYEAILFELTRVAKTDTFKEISRLIK
ncbi:isochorismatase family protein [Lachnospiraceae bacterium MD1]|jgi:nicotinamidase-related amidase|uniref:Isochorismatase family protein n=1 Tax=Variimorphobacter saccharofermentans TaxID=2755051 RepID=A0A839K056_9FIRM|nr:isochorismatase family protein [Variimorphobacter saccharofermentans]MBB2182299.1 isochorismatase family protein [Variimorphobacter saccharofermentans]